MEQSPVQFSIILPTYNREDFLLKAIESVIQQTYSNWELIIVDDGSTDNTKKIVESIQNDRIKYIFQENQERSAARNNGIKNAKGEYICFLDSDDYYLPNRLYDLNSAINQSTEKIAFFYTGISFNHKGQITKRPELKNTFNNSIDFIISATIGTPQACLHSSLLKKHLFNVNLTIGEDMELWVRIAGQCPLIFIDQYTVIANDHDDRSVNEKRYNSFSKQLQTLRVIFNKNHPGYFISSTIKNQLLSNCYYGIARHYEATRSFFPMCMNLLISIAYEPFSERVKKKIYMIYNYFKS